MPVPCVMRVMRATGTCVRSGELIVSARRVADSSDNAIAIWPPSGSPGQKEAFECLTWLILIRQYYPSLKWCWVYDNSTRVPAVKVRNGRPDWLPVADLPVARVDRTQATLKWPLIFHALALMAAIITRSSYNGQILDVVQYLVPIPVSMDGNCATVGIWPF